MSKVHRLNSCVANLNIFLDVTFDNDFYFVRNIVAAVYICCWLLDWKQLETVRSLHVDDANSVDSFCLFFFIFYLQCRQLFYVFIYEFFINMKRVRALHLFVLTWAEEVYYTFDNFSLAFSHSISFYFISSSCFFSAKKMSLKKLTSHGATST